MLKLHMTSTGEPEETSPLTSGTTMEPADVDIRSVGLKWKTKAMKKAEDENKEGKNIQHDEGEKEEGEKMEFKWIIIHAVLLMGIGTGLLSFFSDPMVGVLSDFGDSIHIGTFYISFVITPVCSNASETISSLIFASKKRKQNASLTFAQLYGAATMNNTMVLGIFFALIAFRGLSWTFSAETMAILFVTLCVGLIGAFFKTYRTWMVIPVILLYPLSLLLVWVLETYAKWQ